MFLVDGGSVYREDEFPPLVAAAKTTLTRCNYTRF